MPWILCGPGVLLGTDRRTGQLIATMPHVQVLRLQIFARARDAAAGADARNENIDGAIRILPDLRAGRGAWMAGLAGFVNWGRAGSRWRLRAISLRLGDGAASKRLRTVRQDKLRTRSLGHLALDTMVSRHGQDDAVATRAAASGGKVDAGVAAHRLDDDSARPVSRPRCSASSKTRCGPFTLPAGLNDRPWPAVLRCAPRQSAAAARAAGRQVKIFEQVFESL